MSTTKNEEDEMICSSYFTIYNLNETQNSKHLLEQLKTNYLDIISDSDDCYSCLKAIEEFDKENKDETELENDVSKFDSAIFTFNSANPDEIE